MSLTRSRWIGCQRFIYTDKAVKRTAYKTRRSKECQGQVLSGVFVDGRASHGKAQAKSMQQQT
jgi:hypothetical protein